ncbi:MAG: NADH-quinone oxidoreductase subunit J [Candidatus Kapaibacterium sp.]
MDSTVLIFMILGVLAIASAVFTISSKHPVASAMGLVVHFFMLSGLYLTLQAQFLAVIQILIYAGAIMVLVIFVIMLLNLGKEELVQAKYNTRQLTGIFLATVMVLLMLTAILPGGGIIGLHPDAYSNGTPQAIGTSLYTNYLFAFEAISILLLSAIVGAIILAKRKLI